MAAESVFQITASGAKQAGKDVETLASAQNSNLIAIQKYEKVLGGVRERLDSVHQAMEQTSNLTEYESLSKQAEAYSDKLSKIETNLSRLKSASKSTNESMNDAFDTEGVGYTGGNPLRGLTDALRNFDPESTAGKIGDAVDQTGQLVDTIGQMSQEMKPLVKVFPKAISGIKDLGGQAVDLAKNVFSGSTSLKDVAGGASGGIKSLVSSMGTADGISTLLAANIAVWSKAAEVFAEKAQKAADAANAVTQTQIEIADAERRLQGYAKTGDIDSFNNELAAAKEALDAATTSLQANQQQADVAAKAYDDLGSAFDPHTRAALGQIGADAQKAIADSQKAQQEALTTYSTLLKYQKQVADAAAQVAANERLKEAESDLLDVRLQAIDVQKNLADQIAEFNDQNAFDQKRLTEDRQREDTQQLKDYNDQQLGAIDDANKQRLESEQQYQEQRADMAKDYQKGEIQALKDFNEQAADSQKQLAKELSNMADDLGKQFADADKQYQEESASAAQDYMESELDAVESHNKELLKADDEFNKERKRRLEDLYDELSAAEQQNDVISFIQAQKAGEKDLRRMQEDHDEQASESEQQFDDERQQAREQFEKESADRLESYQKQKADAQAAYEEQRADRIKQYEEERADAVDQFAKEKADRAEQYAEQLAEAQAEHQKELAQQQAQLAETLAANDAAYKKQQEQQAEQREFEDQRREEDLQRQLDQMQKSADKELEALQKREDDLMVVIKSKGTEQVAAVTLSQTQMVAEYRKGADAAVAAVRSAFAQMPKPGTGAKSGSGNSGSGSSGSRSSGGGSRNLPSPTMRRGGTAFAEGGVVDRPTLALLGDDGAEAVVPFDRSEGLDRALMRFGGTGSSKQTVIQFNPVFSPTIGDIASRAEVEAALAAFNESLWTGLNQSIQKARAS